MPEELHGLDVGFVRSWLAGGLRFRFLLHSKLKSGFLDACMQSMMYNMTQSISGRETRDNVVIEISFSRFRCHSQSFLFR